jgi:hydrogenase maturation protease
MFALSPGLPGKTLFIGLGNSILGDDRAGLVAAEKLQEKACPWLSVAVSEQGGFELIDLMTGYDRVILADSWETPDAWPGRVRTVSLADCAGSPRLNGSHDLSLAALLQLARLMGIPIPASVIIYGIETVDTSTFGENLSAEVEEGVEVLVKQISTSFE